MLFFLSGTAISSQASVNMLEMDPCELAYQVAYHNAFQTEYAKCQDIYASDLAGASAGARARRDCLGLADPGDDYGGHRDDEW